MAFAATALSAEPRAFSIGPVKVQLFNCSVASGDVAGTITADRLTTAIHCQISGLNLTAAPTFSGNVVTLAFADPLATRHMQAIVFGK